MIISGIMPNKVDRIMKAASYLKKHGKLEKDWTLEKELKKDTIKRFKEKKSNEN
jgi:hypothetical protein